MKLARGSKPQYWVGGKKKFADASREQVYSAMNVEALFVDPIKKYQFMDLHYQEGFSEADLNLLLKHQGVLSDKGDFFLKASQENNINPIYLIAHAILETDHGQSILAQNNNFFGLGANDGKAVVNGIAFVKKRGWDTPELGISGGAKFISQQWINNLSGTQYTLYAMRWNPINPGHSQYATDINWANSQVERHYKEIARIQKIHPKYQVTFVLPHYQNKEY